jgi:hypothetical protein
MASLDVFGRADSRYATGAARDSTLEAKVNTMLRGIREDPNPLNMAFFGTGNIDALQGRIASVIKQKTGMSIGRQSDDELLVIMRNVYMSAGALRRSGAIGREVSRLNEQVLRIAVPNVGAGLAAYLGYVRDASRLPEPLARGEQTSIKGEKTTALFRPL